jgi:F-type H+-transporting ATPase subunit alpha
VEREVAILYALTRGYLDDVAVEDLGKFEKEFNIYFDTIGREALDAIVKEKALTPEVEELLKSHIVKFKENFSI